MTDYETWQKARLLSVRDRLGVTQIARELGLSRPTVMRILSDAGYRPRRQSRRACACTSS
jgi:DNA-binding phage protein